MSKYEVFDYDIDVWGKGGEDYTINGVIPTGIVIYTDASKSSICEKLELEDPYKIDVCFNKYTSIIYIYYNGQPMCELHEVK